ncbi:hypothetical protein JCM9279_000071 [Rhodotorula babjevae]
MSSGASPQPDAQAEPAGSPSEAPDNTHPAFLAPPAANANANAPSMSRQDSTSSVGVSVSAPSSTGANTPSTVPNTPALSSHYANPSIPPTPSEFSGAFSGPFVRNPALALDSPARELGLLSLAPTPSPPLSERTPAAPTTDAAAAPAGAPAPHAPSGPVTAARRRCAGS